MLEPIAMWMIKEIDRLTVSKKVTHSMLTLHNHDFVFCVISVFIPFLSFTTQSVIITYALTDIQTKISLGNEREEVPASTKCKFIWIVNF